MPGPGERLGGCENIQTMAVVSNGLTCTSLAGSSAQNDAIITPTPSLANDENNAYASINYMGGSD